MSSAAVVLLLGPTSTRRSKRGPAGGSGPPASFYIQYEVTSDLGINNLHENGCMLNQSCSGSQAEAAMLHQRLFTAAVFSITPRNASKFHIPFIDRQLGLIDYRGRRADRRNVQWGKSLAVHQSSQTPKPDPPPSALSPSFDQSHFDSDA